MLVHTALICGAAASRAMRTHFIELARHCIAESMDHTPPYWTSSPLFSYKRCHIGTDSPGTQGRVRGSRNNQIRAGILSNAGARIKARFKDRFASCGGAEILSSRMAAFGRRFWLFETFCARLCPEADSLPWPKTGETKNVSGSRHYLPLFVFAVAVSRFYVAWKYKH